MTEPTPERRAAVESLLVEVVDDLRAHGFEVVSELRFDEVVRVEFSDPSGETRGATVRVAPYSDERGAFAELTGLSTNSRGRPYRATHVTLTPGREVRSRPERASEPPVSNADYGRLVDTVEAFGDRGRLREDVVGAKPFSGERGVGELFRAVRLAELEREELATALVLLDALAAGAPLEWALRHS